MKLEAAKKSALALLTSVPRDAEICIVNVDDHEVWLGIGYCIGKGLATYHGAYCFRITDRGRAFARDLAVA